MYSPGFWPRFICFRHSHQHIQYICRPTFSVYTRGWWGSRPSAVSPWCTRVRMFSLAIASGISKAKLVPCFSDNFSGSWLWPSTDSNFVPFRVRLGYKIANCLGTVAHLKDGFLQDSGPISHQNGKPNRHVAALWKTVLRLRGLCQTTPLAKKM